jgi:hypothetical protein
VPALYPLINGFRYDFSSVEIRVGGTIFNGVKSLKYSQTLEPGKARGNRSQVIGRTRGKLDSDGSIELYRLEFDDLVRALGLLQPGLGYMEVPFDIVAMYGEVNIAQPTVDSLMGCRIKKHDTPLQEGGDAVTVSCDLDVMYVLMNGQAPIGLTNPRFAR